MFTLSDRTGACHAGYTGRTTAAQCVSPMGAKPKDAPKQRESALGREQSWRPCQQAVAGGAPRRPPPHKGKLPGTPMDVYSIDHIAVPPTWAVVMGRGEHGAGYGDNERAALSDDVGRLRMDGSGSTGHRRSGCSRNLHAGDGPSLRPSRLALHVALCWRGLRAASDQSQIERAAEAVAGPELSPTRGLGRSRSSPHRQEADAATGSCGG